MHAPHDHAPGDRPRLPRLRLGLLGRIVLALAAVGLIPLAVVSFRLVDLNQDALTTQVLQTHAVAARTAADQISAFTGSWQDLAEAIAANRDLQSDPHSDATGAFLQNLLQSRPELALVVVRNSDGEDVVRAQRKTLRASEAALAQAGTTSETSLVSLERVPWLVISRPLSAAEGSVLLLISAPGIRESLAVRELGEESSPILVAADRRLLLGYRDTYASMPDRLLAAALDGHVAGSGRFRNTEGKLILAAFSPVQGVPWTVISSQPATIAERVAHQLRLRAAIAVAAAIALTALLSVLAWLFVVRPVRRLLAAQRAAGTVSEEMGEGNELDQMRSTIDVLQRRVADRQALGNVFLGRFQVLDVLGQGGMGTLFRGWDPRLQRSVALKTMRISGPLPDSERHDMVTSLLSEAITVARFSHPNIVAVFDVEEARDAAYIAMEFVDGTNLEKQLLHQRRLDPDQLLSIGFAIASALEAAHDEGIVHCDIKPGNVLIAWDGSIKVTDFGIARFLTAVRNDPGTIYGTPGYLAPEVIRGQAPAPSSDLFSLGVLLYEAATGVRPFDTRGARETLLKTLNEEPRRPSLHNPRIGGPEETIILGLLAKRASDRFQSAHEVAAALAALGAQNRFRRPTASLTSNAIARSRGEEASYVPTIQLPQV